MTAHCLCTPKTHTIIHDRSLYLYHYNTYYYILPHTVFVPLKHILLYMTTNCLCTPETNTIIHDRSLSLYPLSTSKNTTRPLTVFVPLKQILFYITAHCLCTPKTHNIKLHDLSMSFSLKTHTIIHDRSLSLYP